jgi:hypothetical protein
VQDAPSLRTPNETLASASLHADIHFWIVESGVLIVPVSNKSTMPADVPDFSAIISGDQFRSARAARNCAASMIAPP